MSDTPSLDRELLRDLNTVLAMFGHPPILLDSRVYQSVLLHVSPPSLSSSPLDLSTITRSLLETISFVPCLELSAIVTGRRDPARSLNDDERHRYLAQADFLKGLGYVRKTVRTPEKVIRGYYRRPNASSTYQVLCVHYGEFASVDRFTYYTIAKQNPYAKRELTDEEADALLAAHSASLETI